MIGLVLVTHGRLAVEFRAALEHVVGPQVQIEAVTIGPDDDVEERRKDIIEAVRRVTANALSDVRSSRSGKYAEVMVERLKELGCGYAQGFLLARPMPASGIEALLGEQDADRDDRDDLDERPDRDSRGDRDAPEAGPAPDAAAAAPAVPLRAGRQSVRTTRPVLDWEGPCR